MIPLDSCLLFSGVTVFLMDFSAFCATNLLPDYNILFFVFSGLFGLVTITVLAVLSRQPRSPKELSFKVPLVPWIPILSVAINIYLMINLPVPTWKRFALWMAIGFIIYFGYGITESTGYMTEQEKAAHDENKRAQGIYYVQEENTVSPGVVIPSPNNHETTLESID